jgi:MATE family multidrug resistance protein
MGDTLLAANAILMNFQLFLGYALDGFAFAAEALIGAAIGAGSRKQLTDAVKATTLWAGVAAAVFMLAYWLAGNAIITAITDIPEVRAEAGRYLWWAIASPLVSVWSFQLDGIYIGATRTKAMRNGMIISLAVFLGAVWILTPLWGNHGLWLAFYIFMVMRTLTLLAPYPALVRATTPAPAMTVEAARPD